jgi:hypothetical protein
VIDRSTRAPSPSPVPSAKSRRSSPSSDGRRKHVEQRSVRGRIGLREALSSTRSPVSKEFASATEIAASALGTYPGSCTHA